MVYLVFSLGFSASVTLYISFVELMPLALEDAREMRSFIGFFIGILFIGLIDSSLRLRNAVYGNVYRGMAAFCGYFGNRR